MIHYSSPSRKVFNVFNYTFFIIVCLSILLPFINALAISLSSHAAVVRDQVQLWPVDFQLDAYKKLAGNYTFVRSFMNTVFLTVVNTFLQIVVSLASAYALSRKYLIGKKVLFYYILVTMYFSGGLIPFYLLVNNMGLNDTYWALILPGMVSGFYVIVFKNSIDQLPKELIESAEIDGAGEFRMLFRIVLPLVLPMTMAFTIFSAVANWNAWFNVLLFIREKSMWTLQYQLRDILVNANLDVSRVDEFSLKEQLQLVHPENLKMAALMLTVIPIIIVYPFVQKYFLHGQLVGAVKQ